MENQILELEKKYWKAMESRDYNTLKSLTRFPCIIAGKEGVMSVDKPAFKKMFESAQGNETKVLNISHEETQIINENSAVVAYLIELEYNMAGKKTPLKCACTSTWVKDKKNWVCVMHTESDLKK